MSHEDNRRQLERLLAQEGTPYRVVDPETHVVLSRERLMTTVRSMEANIDMGAWDRAASFGVLWLRRLIRDADEAAEQEVQS